MSIRDSGSIQDDRNAATHPDSEGARGLTIEEVKATVLPSETTTIRRLSAKAEWVVNGMEKWGVLEGQEEGVEPWQ